MARACTCGCGGSANVLAVIPRGFQDMVASIIHTIFAEPDREHIEKQFG